MTTPTSTDRSFIAYPLGLDLEFEKCLPDTELQEGKAWASGPMPSGAFSNDAHDPGGKTGEGIEQREYDLKRKQWGLPTRDIRQMSKDEERTIYYTDFWCPFCPILPEGFALEFFDLAVNGGQHRAVETLQKCLDVDVDGQFGNQTLNALHEKIALPGGLKNLTRDFKVLREAFYRSLRTFRYFGSDWIRRSEEIESEAEKMETGGSSNA